MAAEKRPFEWVAGVRLLHLLEGRWTAGQQRDDGWWRAVEHHGGRSAHTFGQRSKRPHECARPAAERSPTHVPGDGHASTCHTPGSSWPPTSSTSAASHGRRRAQLSLPQGDQRVLLEPRGSRRLSSQSLLDVRVSKTILRVTRDASNCWSTCSMCSTTPPRRNWRRTICSARISDDPRSSWIRAALCSP